MTTPTPKLQWGDVTSIPRMMKAVVEGRGIEEGCQLERDLAAAQERIRKSEADIAAMTTYAKTQQDRAQAAEARVEECEMIITAMTQWLEKQQPDVFRRGLWDAIAEGKK